MATVSTDRFQVRWMIRRDMASVLAIEAANGGDWQEETFLSNLRERNIIGMVVEKNQLDIVGHMVYVLHKKRLEVVNFGVCPKHKRRGIGTRMLNKLKGKLNENSRRQLTIDVPDTKLDFHLFLRANSFLAIVSSVPETYHFFYTL